MTAHSSPWPVSSGTVAAGKTERSESLGGSHSRFASKSWQGADGGKGCEERRVERSVEQNSVKVGGISSRISLVDHGLEQHVRRAGPAAQAKQEDCAAHESDLCVTQQGSFLFQVVALLPCLFLQRY